MAKGSGSAGRGGGGGAGRATGTAALTVDNLRSIYNDIETPSGSASIADLRTEFYDRFDPSGQVSAATFDNFLKDAQLNRTVVLTRKDDPQSITARDRRYAVDIFGDPRHVIRFR